MASRTPEKPWATMSNLKTLLCHLLILAMVSLSLPHNAARAAMVQTESVVEGGAELQSGRDRLRTILRRGEARAQMEALGVDPREALARVESLSDREVARIAQQLDQQPAGAGINPIILILLSVGLITLFYFVLVFFGMFHAATLD